MEAFKIIYTVLGGLGIFFYGMKAMSESLQNMAGGLIKNIIASLTSHRLVAVAVGTLVTMLVQSSSITTVMVVGFVNASLMNLTQAIGVIFGANIGTTITGWIISIKIGKYGLLLVGLGIFPALFGKSTKAKNLGRVFFGIGLIFFGLEIMSNAFKPLRTMPEFLEAIAYFSDPNYGAYLACIIVGCILTCIIQSSSAMLGITIALASSGVIQFHTAAALVLGENIGTTITALLASVGGNVHAKRAARAHAIFNMLGVVVLFSVFPLYIQLVDWIIPGDPNLLNAAGEKPNIAVHIATGHTIFNVAATIVFIPFLTPLANLVCKLTPSKGGRVDKEGHLIALGKHTDLLPPAAILQAQKEIELFFKIVDKTFKRVRSYIDSPTDDQDILKEINKAETKTDIYQKEITEFIVHLLEKDLSEEQAVEAHRIIKISDELESITDYLEKLALNAQKFKQKAPLSGKLKKSILALFEQVDHMYQETKDQLQDYSKDRMLEIEKVSNRLWNEAENLRSESFIMLSSEKVSPDVIMYYSDMVVALRKIRSHTLNISQASS
jgi:phosphate:Na+ symporter